MTVISSPNLSFKKVREVAQFFSAQLWEPTSLFCLVFKIPTECRTMRNNYKADLTADSFKNRFNYGVKSLGNKDCFSLEQIISLHFVNFEVLLN